MKFMLLTSSCVFLAALAWGQSGSSLSGTVRDPQQAGIPSASVTLIARDSTTRVSTIADGAGSYRFEHIAPGWYLLEPAAGGFAHTEPAAIQIGKADRSHFDVVLQVAGVATQVAVTASGTPQTADEMSKALSVVDAAEIAARDANAVSDALSGVPGLRIQQLGGPGAFTSFKSRGLRNQDTAVLIDGFRLRDAAATQGDASALVEDLPVTNVDRIEVLRGAGSSIYGSNATGGVINVITNQGLDRTRGSVLLEGGSLGMFRGSADAAGSLVPGKLQYSVGLVHLNVTNGVDGTAPARTSSAQGRTDYAFSPRVRLFGRIFATDSFSKLMDSARAIGALPATGVIDATPIPPSELRRYENGTPMSQLSAAGSTFIPGPDNSDYTRAARVFSGALSLNIRATDSLAITADYQGLRSRRRYGDGPAGAGYQPEGNTLSFYDGEIHTSSTRADWRVCRYQSIDAGYEFENENYGNRSLSPSPAATSAVAVTERSHAFFAQDQIHLLDGRLQLAGSFRAQIFTLGQPRFSPAGSAPYANSTFAAPPAAQTGDGSAAYLLRKTGTKLRAHAGKGYRAPSLYERFGSYYDSAYGYSVYGDPRLRPERSLAMDMGVDQTAWNSRVRVSATYFYTHLEEVIVFDGSGAIVSAVDPYGRYSGYRNTSGGLARGVEFSASLAPARSLVVRTAYTFTDAREQTPLVPGVYRTYGTPDHAFSTAVIQRLSPRLTLVYELAASSNYLAPIYDPATYASRAYRFSGLARLQAGADYRVPLGESSALRLFAKGDNLLNQTRFENGFRTPGATARSGLRFEF